MISKFFLQNMGKNFLFVSCFASSMLIGMDDANAKYATVTLQPEFKNGRMQHVVDVFQWDKRGKKCSIKSKLPVAKTRWHRNKDNILYITLSDGRQNEVVCEVNVETAKKITI